MRTTHYLTAALMVAATLAPRAQQPPAQPPSPPSGRSDQQPPITFKVEINYVEIDAIVTDAQGNFVRNLTKDDFQVFEQGKPQTVSVFSLVDIPLERPDAPLFAASPIEPDVRSNRKEFDGRVFVLVLDDLNTSFSRTERVRTAAKQFIERHFGANDLAAIVQTGGSKGGAQEFTGSRQRLMRAIDTFSGQKLRSATLEKIDDYYRQRDLGSGDAPTDSLESERAFKARNTYATLKAVADYMAGVRGRRKAVIFFSEGVDYDITNPIQNRYATDILDESREAIAAASRANVSFYSVDPRGLGGLGDEMMQIQSIPQDNTLGVTTLHDELRNAQDSLRIIADETGGFATVNQNDFQDAFRRIVQDNSSYYVLGYYSSDTRRDGRFRPIQVRVTRPGLEVRARKGYVAPKGRPANAASTNSTTSTELRDALNSPVPVSGLGLTVFAAPLKGAAPNASVSVSLEIDGRALRFTEKDGIFHDDVEISAVAIDGSGKMRDGGRDLINLRLRPQTHAVVSTNGVRVMRRFELPPGRYHLRVGARDVGSGAVGSVMYDLDVPDFSKGALSMSGLLLTSMAGSRMPTANPDPEFKNVLPAAPIALREFQREDTLSVFTEVYDNNVRTPHRVSIRTTVLADDGRAVFTSEDERRTEELQGARGGFGYTGTIPLKDLAPGRYVLRVEARQLLSNGETATRDVEFRVR